MLQGFDIQDYSKFSNPGLLVRLHCPPEKSTSETFKAELQDCSCIAIDVYNRKHVWDSMPEIFARFLWLHLNYDWPFFAIIREHIMAMSMWWRQTCKLLVLAGTISHFKQLTKKTKKKPFKRVNISFSKLEKVPKLEKGPKFDTEVELVRIQTAPKPIVITRSYKGSHR